MTAMLQIRDETGAGKILETFQLLMPSARTTVRDIISERVRQEVSAFNREAGAETFRGLVMPDGAELVLNGFKLKNRRTIDASVQVARALDAFGRNAFFIIVDDAQVDDLNQVVEITPQTSVGFVRLVQLVGG